MKIAFIVPSLLNRGPIVFTKYLTDALMASGIDVTLFYLKPQVEFKFNCECVRLHFSNLHKLEDFDIVHTTMFWPDIVGLIMMFCRKVNWVSSIHNEIGKDLRFNYGALFGVILGVVWRIVLRQCPNIIVSSNEQLSYCKSYIGSKRPIYSVIGYGIATRSTNPLSKTEDSMLSNLKKHYLIIGACGLLIKRKGFSQLVTLLSLRRDIAVVLIGDGGCKSDLLTEAESLGVKDRFVILGFKTNHLDYYPYFDIYALTSYSEGFGLAMIEAMSLGLPVLCSNLPIYHDYFDSTQVCLFEPGHINELSSAVDMAIERLTYFGAKSYDLYSNKFSSSVMAQKHIEVYKFVVFGSR